MKQLPEEVLKAIALYISKHMDAMPSNALIAEGFLQKGAEISATTPPPLDKSIEQEAEDEVAKYMQGRRSNSKHAVLYEGFVDGYIAAATKYQRPATGEQPRGYWIDGKFVLPCDFEGMTISEHNSVMPLYSHPQSQVPEDLTMEMMKEIGNSWGNDKHTSTGS